ncbi:MAG: helix-turn-helix transcriptional regulator [Alphaproteobacteria bacterium]|nr:helix-turn-helix transcriptional regulator [Alphaproteobacteria bacterium]
MPVEKRNNINARQIKAARALLDWSQEDLASASGLSIATIRKIESGALSPRDKTMGAIVSALEEANIEFTDSTGVRVRSNMVTVLEGQDSYLRLLDDVFHNLKDKGGEVLIWYADNSVSPQAVVDSEERMRKQGIRFRFLVEEGDTFLYFPLGEYRWIPKKYFRNAVIEIYADKVALNIYPNLSTQHISNVIIIENPALAEAMRNAFNFMWENCRKPTLTTAPQVFK